MRNTIPFDRIQVADFVETFDTDEDDTEPANILSFELLRNAFAMNNVAEPERETPESERPDYEIEDATASEEESNEPLQEIECPITVGIRLETIVEAMLFVGNRENKPIAAAQMAEKLRNVVAEEVEQAIEHLNRHYKKRDCPFSCETLSQ